MSKNIICNYQPRCRIIDFYFFVILKLKKLCKVGIFLAVISTKFLAGSTPKTFNFLFLKIFNKVPSFDPISRIKSFFLTNRFLIMSLTKF